MAKHLMMAILALSIGTFAVTAAEEPKEEKKEEKKSFGGRDPGTAFKKMDADGDGTVTKEEFKKGFGSGFGKGRPEGKAPEGRGELADRMFDRLDADKNGKLTEEEYKKGMSGGFGGGGFGGKGKFDPEKLKQFKDKKKPTDN